MVPAQGCENPVNAAGGVGSVYTPEAGEVSQSLPQGYDGGPVVYPGPVKPSNPSAGYY